jgi:hypothetical protein
VQKQLDRAGVSAGSGSVGAEARGGVLRIEVGKWSDLSRLQELELLLKGPAVSGVYARFATQDGGLQLLDASGKLVRSAPPGTGLLAAVIPAGQQPLWVVTGVDDAGVARAASELDVAKLRNAYAVAVTPSGVLRLPLGAGQ